MGRRERIRSKGRMGRSLTRRFAECASGFSVASMRTFEKTLAVVRRGMAEGLHVGAQVYVSVYGEVAIDAAVGVARPAGEGRDEVAMTPETIRRVRDNSFIWVRI